MCRSIHFALIETSLKRLTLYKGWLIRPKGRLCREVQVYKLYRLYEGGRGAKHVLKYERISNSYYKASKTENKRETEEHRTQNRGKAKREQKWKAKGNMNLQRKKTYD